MNGPAVAAELWEGARPTEWMRRWRVPALRIFTETGSTNSEARSLAMAGAPAGTTVIADHQWAGRGREGRYWRDEPGQSLLLSIILRPPDAKYPDGTGPAPLRVGLAVCSAIERCCALDARLKWPNDILAPDGRKIAGILCEAASGAGGTFVIAGIGANILQTDGSWLDGLEGVATSIRAVTGKTPDRAALAGAILDALRPFEVRGLDLDDAEMLEFRRRDALSGRSITLDDRAAGTARGIRADGALLVDSPAGLRIVRAGSVRTRAKPNAEPTAATPETLHRTGPA